MSTGFTPNYSKPFELSMSVKTSPLIGFGKEGIIYSDRRPQSVIEIRWTKRSSIKLLISNFDMRETWETEELNINEAYDLKLSFDGNKCEWYLDDKLMGIAINCSSGFRELGNPMLCHASTSGWFGWITNLKFENIGINICFTIIDFFIFIFQPFLSEPNSHQMHQHCQNNLCLSHCLYSRFEWSSFEFGLYSLSIYPLYQLDLLRRSKIPHPGQRL